MGSLMVWPLCWEQSCGLDIVMWAVLWSGHCAVSSLVDWTLCCGQSCGLDIVLWAVLWYGHCDVSSLVDWTLTKNCLISGVAFRGLPNVNLYPAVSAVYGNTEVSMVYLGQPLDG